MKSGIRDQVEGKAKQAKGAAKQAYGRAAGDPKAKMSGTIDRAKGKMQEKTGRIKRDVTRA